MGVKVSAWKVESLWELVLPKSPDVQWNAFVENVDCGLVSLSNVQIEPNEWIAETVRVGELCRLHDVSFHAAQVLPGTREIHDGRVRIGYVNWLAKALDSEAWDAWACTALEPLESTFAPYFQVATSQVVSGKGGQPWERFPNNTPLPGFGGTEDSTLATVAAFYYTFLRQKWEQHMERWNHRTQDWSDMAWSTAGRALVGASIATPLGLAAGLAAVHVSDRTKEAARSGQQDRGGSDSYRFGDVTRGLIKSFQESETTDSGEVKQPTSNRTTERYSGVVGGSVGAMAGMMVLGPVGLLAGSLVGQVAGKSAGKSMSSRDMDTDDQKDPRADDSELFGTVTSMTDHSETDQSITLSMRSVDSKTGERKPYRFGDVTRGIVARGKAARGDSSESSYKFGDFTRGLLSRKSVSERSVS